MGETKIEMKLEEETKSLKKVCEKLEEVVKHQFDNGIEQIDTKEMSEVIDMWKDICEAKEKVIKACYYKYILSAMEKEEEEDKEYKKFMEKMRMNGDTEEDDMEAMRRNYDNWRYERSGRYAPKGRGTYEGRRSGRRNYMPMDIEDYTGMTEEQKREADCRMGRMYPMMNYDNRGSMSSNSGNMGGNSERRNYEDGMRDGETKGYERGNDEGYRRGYAEGSRNSSNTPQSGMERARRNYEDMKGKSTDNVQKARELEKLLAEVETYLNSNKGSMSAEERTVMKNRMAKMSQSLSA